MCFAQNEQSHVKIMYVIIENWNIVLNKYVLKELINEWEFRQKIQVWVSNLNVINPSKQFQRFLF